MALKLILLLCALTIFKINAQIISGGSCETVNAIHIPAKDIVGVWYEIYRYENTNQLQSESVKFEVVKNPIASGGFDFVMQYNHTNELKGEGLIDEENIFMRLFSSYRVYNALSFNSHSHLLLYACEEQDLNKKVHSWILSRYQFLSPQAIISMDQIMNSSAGLHWDSYRITDQNNCTCNEITTTEKPVTTDGPTTYPPTDPTTEWSQYGLNEKKSHR